MIRRSLLALLLLFVLPQSGVIIVQGGGAPPSGQTLADTFGRTTAPANDIDADSTGMSGTLSPMTYTEIEEGCTNGWEINSTGDALRFDVTGNNNCDTSHPQVKTGETDGDDQWILYQRGGDNSWDPDGGRGFLFRAKTGASSGANYTIACRNLACDTIRWEKHDNASFTAAISADGDCDGVGDSWSGTADGDWVGAAVTGTGSSTTVDIWDFSTTKPGAFGTWGAATCALTNDPGANNVDTGTFLGLKIYTDNAGSPDWMEFDHWEAGDQ